MVKPPAMFAVDGDDNILTSYSRDRIESPTPKLGFPTPKHTKSQVIVGQDKSGGQIKPKKSEAPSGYLKKHQGHQKPSKSQHKQIESYDSLRNSLRKVGRIYYEESSGDISGGVDSQKPSRKKPKKAPAPPPKKEDDDSFDQNQEEQLERSRLYRHMLANLDDINRLKVSKTAKGSSLARNHTYVDVAKTASKEGMADDFWIDDNETLRAAHGLVAMRFVDQANKKSSLAKKVVSKDLALKLDKFVSTNYAPQFYHHK